MKPIAVTVLAAALLIPAAACQAREQDSPDTVKVMYFNEKEFYSRFGSLLAVKEPHLELDIIELDPYYKQGMSAAVYEDIVERERPDILFGFPLERYVQESRLIDLEPFLSKSSTIDLGKVNPNIISYLRNKGNGRLFMLTPDFHAKGTYYNKQLFDQYGVPYPANHVTWEDVLQLASRFPAAEGIAGLYADVDHPFSLVADIAADQQLMYTDAQRRMVMHTTGWKSMLSSVLDGYRKGAITGRTPLAAGTPVFASQQEHPFFAGKAALLVDYSYQLANISRAKLDWGVATSPVSSSHERAAQAIQPTTVLGISAKSGQVGAAWKVLEWIHSEEAASIRKKADASGTLSIYEGDLTYDGVSIEVLYKLAPLEQPPVVLSDEERRQINDWFREGISSVLDEQQELDAMLAELDQKGQAMLLQREER